MWLAAVERTGILMDANGLKMSWNNLTITSNQYHINTEGMSYYYL
jgi:hypothetical protein